jgi:hypothetical protein
MLRILQLVLEILSEAADLVLTHPWTERKR